MKIAICEFGQESNCFVPGHCSFERLAPTGWYEPDAVLREFDGRATYLGGMLQAAREENVQVLPLPSIKITAGPVLARATVEQVLEHICGALQTIKEDLDGICFALHGAGCAEGIDDLEMYTIQALRRVVGDEMPIMCSADLHANVSAEFVAQIQGLFGIKEYPHVDCDRAGYMAMKNLAATVREELHPRMALCRLPLLISVAVGNTFASPMLDIKNYCSSYCKEHGLVDVSFFQGFSSGDLPDVAASVLVIADGCDPEPHALHLARYAWSMREKLQFESLTPEQAIDRALTQVKDGYVVINEISDNVGSGCPGDGTHTLRVLLERDVPRSIFQYIYDPQVAEQAHGAGVGARISIRLGAKFDNMSGDTLELDNVEVLALPKEETCTVLSPMHHGVTSVVGKTARLRHGNVEFIVVSVRRQPLDDGVITMTGADIRDYQLVCLKSANHFRAYFESRADGIVTSSPPGLGSGDLSTYPYRRIRRPIYPLDPDTCFL